jgi:hypothetical protein
MFNVFKLDLLSFTQANTLSNKLNELNKKFTWFAMVVLCILNIPIITWVSFNELLMELKIMAKMLNIIHDIQRF